MGKRGNEGDQSAKDPGFGACVGRVPSWLKASFGFTLLYLGLIGLCV